MDPFQFRNQNRQDRVNAQQAASAQGNRGRKGNRHNGHNGGGKGNNGNGDGTDTAAGQNNQRWNEQPVSFLQYLGAQGNLNAEGGSFGNFADSLYTGIENQYLNSKQYAKNGDLDFTDWFKKQDQYGNVKVTNANKNPKPKNVQAFNDYVMNQYYNASAAQRGLDTAGYGAGSTRWSAF